MSSPAVTRDRINIARRLSESAHRYPFQRAVVFPAGTDNARRITYSHFTFRQLDRESDRLARGLREMGVQLGTRLALFVRPSLESIALTFAVFKAGAVAVMIDPGMGRSRVFNCLGQVEPEGFIAIPPVHAVRIVSLGRFRQAKFNVTVGRRWFWGGPNYHDLLGPAWEPFPIVDTHATDPAAILFTSGSTGPPKGVVYEHGMFAAQVDELRDFYGIQPGEIDLPGFPLFALFNSAMGVTTIIPDTDPSRPAQVDPAKLVEAIENQGVTQAFGSPAIWNRVGQFCEQHDVKLPTLTRVLSSGAPVPVHVIERMLKALPDDGDIHTPYGATESLPVASIGGREVLAATAEKSRTGAGTCVGRIFPGINLKIIPITEEPIESFSDVTELPIGEIGEIVVQGPVVTREYFRQEQETRAAKISDGDSFWHRIGDVGSLDEHGLLWMCGRKAHVVETPGGRMFTVCCEAIFNEHPMVSRCALVGIGTRPNQQPVIVVEPEPDEFPDGEEHRGYFCAELHELAVANQHTRQIDTFLFHHSLPVDVRHNVKISREELAVWAEQQPRSTT